MRTCVRRLALRYPAGQLLGRGAGLLDRVLAACSSPASSPARTLATPPAAPTSPAAAAPALYRADSLGGLPGHRFGEPLRAFPGLVRVPADPPGAYQVYKYPSERPLDKSWFGRHQRALSCVHYLFVGGRFAGLRTAQQRPYELLTQEAIYLLGHGQGAGDRVSWTGPQVVASWQPVTFFTGTSGQQLELLSRPVYEQLRQQAQQRQRAENAPR